jgi:histidinol-phosphatase (PHP family)
MAVHPSLAAMCQKFGQDAHNNNDLEVPIYYERALQELKELKIKTTDTLKMMY